MAQSRRTYKGERDQVLAPLAEIVYAEIAARAADYSTSVSQVGADLLAIATGHPELVRELQQEMILTTSPADCSSPTGRGHNVTRRPTMFRVPRPVYADIRTRAGLCHTDAGQIAADLLAIATGHHSQLIRQFDEEVMPLAM